MTIRLTPHFPAAGGTVDRRGPCRPDLLPIQDPAQILDVTPLVGSCSDDPDAIVTYPRACAIEGSPQAQELSPGESADGDFLDRIDDAGRIWQAEANLRIAAPWEYLIVEDPRPPLPGEFLGDVRAGFLALEPQLAADACRAAWLEHDPDKEGFIIVNARAFTGAGLALGVTPSVPLGLHVASASPLTGKRGDDLCGHPRQLEAADVAETSWTVVVDQDFYGGSTYSGVPIVALAHEIGHVLTLGHGNGLDDNNDGTEPPDDGPRRYDSYCDPLATNTRGVPIEDEPVDFVDCETSSSLMKPTGTNCANLRPLQIEQARTAALLTPGTSLGGFFIDVG